MLPLDATVTTLILLAGLYFGVLFCGGTLELPGAIIILRFVFKVIGF